jgi:hypothetical protein
MAGGSYREQLTRIDAALARGFKPRPRFPNDLQLGGLLVGGMALGMLMFGALVIGLSGRGG